MFIREKSELKTNKLYYNFPIILVGYKDDKFNYNATTTSASYSLGNTINIGIKSDSNSTKLIKKYKEFTINIPSKELMSEVEICGLFSGNNKLQQADMPYTIGKYVNAPLIDECIISFECKVVKSYDFEGYTHFLGEIKRRIADKDLVAKDGSLKSEEISTIHYVGCSKERIYRYVSSDNAKTGTFTFGGHTSCG